MSERADLLRAILAPQREFLALLAARERQLRATDPLAPLRLMSQAIVRITAQFGERHREAFERVMMLRAEDLGAMPVLRMLGSLGIGLGLRYVRPEPLEQRQAPPLDLSLYLDPQVDTRKGGCPFRRGRLDHLGLTLSRTRRQIRSGDLMRFGCGHDAEAPRPRPGRRPPDYDALAKQPCPGCQRRKWRQS